MKIKKSILKEMIKEEYQNVLCEQELKTVGDLRAVLRKIQLAKKAGKVTDVAKDIAVGAVLDIIPGASTAMNVFDVVKSVWDPSGKKPDKKTGSPLDKLQIDPEISAIVDDTVEEKFLIAVGKEFEKADDNTPLDSLDMTKSLQKYIGQEYDKRSVSTPED